MQHSSQHPKLHLHTQKAVVTPPSVAEVWGDGKTKVDENRKNVRIVSNSTYDITSKNNGKKYAVLALDEHLWAIDSQGNIQKIH